MNVVLPPGTKIMSRNASLLVFELPDMQHECTIIVYTHLVYMYVTSTNRFGHDIQFTFDKRKVSEKWEDIAQSFIEKAVKKYPKQIRHKSVTEGRIKRGY